MGHSLMWQPSLAGSPEASSVCNMYCVVQAVTEQRSLGVIVAHCSGPYHLTPHLFSWPGLMVGSGLSWNPATHWFCYTVPRHSKKSQLKECAIHNANIKNLTHLPYKNTVKG